MANNILIFKFGALGDVIMATPLIKAIIDSSKHNKYTLITTSPFVEIFKDWSQLSVKTIDNSSILANLRFVSRLRKESYSCLFDLQSNDRSRTICLLSGIRNSVGNHRFPYKYHPPLLWEGETHIFQRMCDVLNSGGITVKKETPFLPASEKQQIKVKNWISQHFKKETPFVLLHAGSSKLRPDKRWPYFEQLARALNNRGLGIVWVGGPDDFNINKRLCLKIGLNATNIFDVVELAELGRNANFAVTNDSGPMHILSASGIPVFGLFGPSSKNKNHALGQKERALSIQDYKGLEHDVSEVDLSKLPLEYVIEQIFRDDLFSN